MNTARFLLKPALIVSLGLAAGAGLLALPDAGAQSAA